MSPQKHQARQRSKASISSIILKENCFYIWEDYSSAVPQEQNTYIFYVLYGWLREMLCDNSQWLQTSKTCREKSYQAVTRGTASLSLTFEPLSATSLFFLLIQYLSLFSYNSSWARAATEEPSALVSILGSLTFKKTFK